MPGQVLVSAARMAGCGRKGIGVEAKLFELRDKGTFVPALCILMESKHDQEAWLLRRSGFARGQNLVIMTGIQSHPDKASYSPYDWGDNRTRQVAHNYITTHWKELPTGAVIDVEFILGEVQTPKNTERMRM